MRVLDSHGEDGLARVWVAETAEGHRFDFALTSGPRATFIVSTLVGCPVKCVMCDAGGHYEGRLTAAEINGQLEVLTAALPSDTRALSVQFNRMGDPAFNDAVLEVLATLPERLPMPDLLVQLSTVAPGNTAAWFDELLALKRRRYGGGRLELQFSLHATDEATRARLVPVKCWSFEQLSAFATRWLEPHDRKLVLNLPLARQTVIDPPALRTWFDPRQFLVKLSVLNPTEAAARAGLTSLLEPGDVPFANAVAQRFSDAGYETMLSLSEAWEQRYGTTCGMYLGGGRDAPVRPRRTLRR